MPKFDASVFFTRAGGAIWYPRAYPQHENSVLAGPTGKPWIIRFHNQVQQALCTEEQTNWLMISRRYRRQNQARVNNKQTSKQNKTVQAVYLIRASWVHWCWFFVWGLVKLNSGLYTCWSSTKAHAHLTKINKHHSNTKQIHLDLAQTYAHSDWDIHDQYSAVLLVVGWLDFPPAFPVFASRAFTLTSKSNFTWCYWVIVPVFTLTVLYWDITINHGNP